MTFPKFATMAALIFFALAIPEKASAQFNGRGPIHGYAVKDRWDNHILHAGTQLLFLSENAAAALAEFEGQPLRIVATEIDRGGATDGAVLVRGIEDVSVAGGLGHGMALSAKVKSHEVHQGDGLSVEVGFHNPSELTIDLLPGTFAIALVTDSPFSNQSIGYQDTDGIGYWYWAHQYPMALRDKASPERKKIVSFHRILLPWKSEDLVKRGTGIRVPPGDKGGAGWVEALPDARFEATVVVGRELLPDDYEMFFYVETNGPSHPAGPMSSRVDFVVTPKLVVGDK